MIVRSQISKAKMLNEGARKQKHISAKAFANLLMKLNPSIVNAIPNDDGSVTVIST